jgi:HTH-type transcriptional regulator, competence development regulator
MREKVGFGELVRQKREAQGLLLRQAAAHLEVDTAYVSKIEHNARKASKEQVEKLAVFLGMPAQELVTVWLAERLGELVNGEPSGEEALKLALKNLKKK